MKTLALVPLSALALLAACGGDSSTSPTAVKAVGLSFSGQPPVAASSLRLSVTAGDGSNTIVIDSVKMTLEDVDLERTAQSVDCENVADADDHADCSDYFAGPYLVKLVPGTGATSALNLDAQTGTYDVISFDISVPDGGDPEQLAYLAANPDMDGVSLRVFGSYNGTPFSFALDLRGDQEIAIDPPLEVTDGVPGALSVRVNFDVASWFRRADGTIINPNTVCSPDEGCADRTRIEQNIEQSIESYSDE